MDFSVKFPVTPYTIIVVFLITIPAVLSDVLVGAFNVQTFGQTKYGNVTLRNHLTAIVTQYDVILIQEIKDVSETMIFKFLVDCRSTKPNLDMVVSPRLGTTSYKEQYAIIFDSSKLSVEKHTVYSNPRGLFSRPPITAHFSSPGLPDFTVFGLHADPDDVVQELDEFPAAYEEALAAGYPPQGIFMGDMNADCSYLSNTKYESLALSSDSRFAWLVDKTFDTTVSQNTDCSYDRIVLCGDLSPESFVKTTVHHFDEDMSNDLAKKVSDHYPISTTWLAEGSNDGGGDDSVDNAAGQIAFYITSFVNETLCFYFPFLAKHKHEEWFEAALVFFTAVVILLFRRVTMFLGFVVL